ncbi:MAG: MMPL family transporter [Flavobacteriales bacterium]|nr:MMPL family transporter [Flavobacteriales bacterium]
MWKKFSFHLLSNQPKYLVFLLLIILTFVFGIVKNGLNFSTSSAQLLPDSDSATVNFNKFVEKFGKEDNAVFLGYYEKEFKTEKQFQNFQQLIDDISKLPGVSKVISPSEAIILKKDTVNEKFTSESIAQKPKSLKEWKQVHQKLENYPFYENLLFNSKTNAWQNIIYFQQSILDTKLREDVTLLINTKIEEFEAENSIELYASGMPLIRTMNKQVVVSETSQYVLISFLTTLLIFFLLFRSLKATLIVCSVVLLAIICSFGTIALLNYKISILTGLVPPIIIVICVPNCVFIINKYVQELRKHKNRPKGLIRSISKIGRATLLTNLSTAFGFFTFIFTDSKTLQEFGIVASINIMLIFVISIILIPIILANIKLNIKTEEEQQNKFSKKLTNTFRNLIQYKRKPIYFTSLLLLILAGFGITKLKKSSNILDDMSKKATYYSEISFFDENFGGILPLEIIVNGKPKSATNYNTLKKVEELNSYIDSLGISSRLISVNELVKFSNQAFYNNEKEYFYFPSKSERTFLMRYIKNSKGNTNQLNAYVDSTQSTLRLTTLLKNSNSDNLESDVLKIENKVNQLFNKKETFLTGASYLFMKGTNYLTQNLLVSILLAFTLIGILMAFIFRSASMVFISLIPNILPLVIVAGIMGFLGISIKPSTILVFSVSFGIAVDDTIHFLAKYKQELKLYNFNIKHAVYKAFEETSQSMYFSSLILFFGFSMFLFSGFEGIQSLGGLVALTLLIAMFTNLILLPSLLLSLNQNKEKKASLERSK